MTISVKWLCAMALFAALMTGCDQLPGAASSVAVIDLGAVAQATGQEAEIQKQAEAARSRLNGQLQEALTTLEGQLAEESAKFGDAPTAEQQQQLQQLAGEAQRQYSGAQQQAQAQVQQFETNLVMAFRERVQPFAEQVALARGAKVVMLADITMFWFEPSVDITDEVIAKLRANPSVFAPEPASPVPASPVPASQVAPEPASEPAPAEGPAE